MRTLVVAAALSGPLLVACRDATGPDARADVRVEPDWVTGAAAAAVDPATGLFILSHPEPRSTSLEHAKEVAVAWARSLASPYMIGNAAAVLQQDRQGPIDFASLETCPRASYVVSAFGEFPEGTPLFMVRAFGPKWAVPLCGRDGRAQMAVDVADNPLGIHIENGEIRFLDANGSLNSAGVPHRYPSGYPLTPEAAVGAAARATGLRVSSVPGAFNQLDNAGYGNIGHCASWRVDLEAPVRVRSETTNETRDTEELFVRHAPACYSDSVTFFVVSPEQPAGRWIHYPVRTSADELAVDSIYVPLTGPTLFERVTIEPRDDE